MKRRTATLACMCLVLLLIGCGSTGGGTTEVIEVPQPRTTDELIPSRSNSPTSADDAERGAKVDGEITSTDPESTQAPSNHSEEPDHADSTESEVKEATTETAPVAGATALPKPPVHKAGTKPVPEGGNNDTLNTTTDAERKNEFRTVVLNFATLTIPEDWQRSPDETGDSHIALKPTDRATGVRLDIFRDATPVTQEAQVAYLDAYQEALKRRVEPEGLVLISSQANNLALLRMIEVFAPDPSKPGARSGLWQVHRVIFGQVATWTFVLTTRDESSAQDLAFMRELLAGEGETRHFVPKPEGFEKSSRASRLDLRFGVPEKWGSEIQRNDVVRLTAPVGTDDVQRHQTITIAALGQRIVGIEAHRRFARRAQSEIAALYQLHEDDVKVSETTIAGFTRIDVAYVHNGRVGRKVMVFGNRRTHIFTLDGREGDAKNMLDALEYSLKYFNET